MMGPKPLPVDVEVLLSYALNVIGATLSRNSALGYFDGNCNYNYWPYAARHSPAIPFHQFAWPLEEGGVYVCVCAGTVRQAARLGAFAKESLECVPRIG